MQHFANTVTRQAFFHCNWMNQQMLLAHPKWPCLSQSFLVILRLNGIFVYSTKKHSTAQDSFFQFKNIISFGKIPNLKMVGLRTDGASAMLGCDKGLVASCRKDESFPRLLCYHCIIKQQALRGSFLNLNNVMKLVVKMCEQNKSSSVITKKIVQTCLIDEIDCQYGRQLLLVG